MEIKDKVTNSTTSIEHRASSIEKGFGRIGVLMGGISCEREISLKSGKAVYESLKQAGLDCVTVDINSADKKENIRLLKTQGIDCAFLALHGCYGEDGRIQEVLETAGIPYTGSGVIASRLAMDKIASRRIFEAAGLSVPSYKVVDKNAGKQNWRACLGLKLPLVIKPGSGGSSIGTSIIDKQQDLGRALEIAFEFDDKALVEEYIKGRELTVGILDSRALPVIEVVPKNRFFDYQAKYQSGMTDYIVPAELNEDIALGAQSTAVKVNNLLGCFGCSRVDMILGQDNNTFVLELNSIPGFTPASLLPKAAKAAGIEFTQLCIKLLELAYAKA